MYREVLAMNKAGERLYNGIIKENPTFVLMLGMCPTLAVTTSAMNGLGMGLTTAVVLTMSNLIISLLRKVIPSRVRIPAFIVIIASFVTGCFWNAVGLCDPDNDLRRLWRKYCFVCGNPSDGTVNDIFYFEYFRDPDWA